LTADFIDTYRRDTAGAAGALAELLARLGAGAVVESPPFP
jgi:hypothetical protein